MARGGGGSRGGGGGSRGGEKAAFERPGVRSQRAGPPPSRSPGFGVVIVGRHPRGCKCPKHRKKSS